MHINFLSSSLYCVRTDDGGGDMGGGYGNFGGDYDGNGYGYNQPVYYGE